MPGGGDSTTTTVQKADPWKPIQPYLKGAAGDAQSLYERGGFAPKPYGGERVAGFGETSSLAQQMMLGRAGEGAPLTELASGTFSDMMSGGWQSDQLDAVKNEALSSAIPAAVAQFSGSGMTNSSQAQEAVGRAATQAVAPYEYDAFGRAQDRSMQAASAAPQIDAAGYMPAHVIAGIGGQRDAMEQAQIDADMSEHYERENQERDNLQQFTQMLMGYGGMGGTTTGTQTVPGASGAQKMGSAALGGLGTYGALAGIPGIGPGLAVGGGIASGLMGLL